ncbi:MAG: type II secretion system F family protein [Frankiaceae bacterium]|nr:type II secretion system F family protein [Frankiaceae bacterium]
MRVLAAGLAAAAVLLTGPPSGRRRLRCAEPATSTPRATTAAPAVACVVAGLGVAVVVGLPVGPLLGLAVAAAGPLLLARLEPAAARRDREQLTRDLPLVLDLLAACLAGGSSLSSAAAAVGAAVPGPCGRRLASVHSALSVGTPPGDAWLLLAGSDADDPLAPSARLLARAADGGTPISAAVGRQDGEARATAVAAGAHAARRVGVLVVAPLGLCFLPAFVLLGIVPVLAGLVGPVLRAF